MRTLVLSELIFFHCICLQGGCAMFHPTMQTPTVLSMTFKLFQRQQHIPIRPADIPTSLSSMKACGLVARSCPTHYWIPTNCDIQASRSLTNLSIANIQFPFTMKRSWYHCWNQEQHCCSLNRPRPPHELKHFSNLWHIMESARRELVSYTIWGGGNANLWQRKREQSWASTNLIHVQHARDGGIIETTAVNQRHRRWRAEDICVERAPPSSDNKRNTERTVEHRASTSPANLESNNPARRKIGNTVTE